MRGFDPGRQGVESMGPTYSKALHAEEKLCPLTGVGWPYVDNGYNVL